MTTIVYANPSTKSFCHAIMQQVITKLKLNNETYEVIDLAKDNFSASFTLEDYEAYNSRNKNLYTDKLVLHYQELLSKTNRLIFIAPIYWFSLPASIKGFFDKVITLMLSFKNKDFSKITRVDFITTSASTNGKTISGYEVTPIDNNYIEALSYIGVNNTHWYNFTGIGYGTHNNDYYNKMLDSINQIIS